MKKKIVKMELSEERFEELCINQGKNLNSKEEEEVWFNECLRRDTYRPDIPAESAPPKKRRLITGIITLLNAKHAPTQTFRT
jgi:hypothetical protein